MSDSQVPPLCSTGFVERMKQIHPDVPLLFSLQQGDHGFEAVRDGAEAWIQEGVQFVQKYWL